MHNTTEFVSVSLAMLLAIALGVALFAGNQTEKLTLKSVLTMVVTGVVAGVMTWTYLKDEESTKVVVRNILIYTFGATVFAKLIGRIINSLTTIPQKHIQKIGIDFIRKKAGLDASEKEDFETENNE